ncbi:hypothetical protein ABIF30_007261 [Bradyrhizobium elkanii]
MAITARADVVGDRQRLPQRRVGQHHGEFLAAIAGGDVLALDVLLQRLRHQPQHLIAGEMAVGVVERLEVVDVEHQERQRLAAGERGLHRHVDRAVEIFPVAEAGERIGQALGADRLEAVLQVADLRLRQREPVLQRLIGLAHLARRFYQAIDDCLDVIAGGRARKLVAGADEAGVIGRGHAERVGDQLHDGVDLADDAGADLVDAVRGLDVRKVGFVDLLEIGFRELAAARQRLVDDLVERRVVSGRVDVPDFIVAGDGGLAKRADLAKCDFGKGQRTFVLVQQLDHCHVLNARNAD